MKTKKVLGLDLGGSTFKAVLLEAGDSKPVLVRARLLELPAQADPAARRAALKSLLEEMQPPQGAQVVSVVDDPFACLHQVLVPPMPAAEMADAVKWELQRFLAVPPEEVTVGCRVLGQQQVDGVKKQRLVAAALPSSRIREHLSFLAQAGIRPVQLVPKSSALNAWFGRNRPPAGPAPVGLLEVGGSGSEFIVLENGEAVFARKISGGAEGLTKEMTGVLMTEQGQVSLTETEAEKVKRSAGIPAGEASGLEERRISGAQIFSLIRGSLERLATEAERSLAFYSESGGQAPVGEILLVGGGAHLKGLPEWLQNRLGVQVGAPRVSEGVASAPGAFQGGAAAMELSLAAALGAALGAGEGINLLPLELQESLKGSIQRAALKAALTGTLLGAMLLWIGLQTYHRSLLGQIAAFEVERKAVAPQMPSAQAALAAHDRWKSEPDWEEIFRSLTYRVPSEAYLTAMTVNGRELVLRGRVRKAGRSADQVLAQFLQALSQSPFSQAALHSSRQMEQSPDLAEFEIGAHLS